MYNLLLLSLFAPLLLGQTFSPPGWVSSANLNGKLYCARASDRATSQIVASPVPSNTIWQITSLCETTNGGLVNPDDCHFSILNTAAAFGLSVLYWQQASYWGGVNGANRRSTSTSTDAILSRIPAHIPISNVKLNKSPMPVRRAKRNAEEFNVFYNGSLPLTFIIHHQLNSTRRSSAPKEIPLFAATDGQNMYLTHITPFNSTPAASSLAKRSGFDGFNYVGTGGLKLQTMSDPVSQWTDVWNWMNTPTEAGNQTPYDVVLDQAQTAGWLGHSFLTFVHDSQTGKGDNGQWAMEGEVGSFGTDWDPNWNWCFGVYPQNC
ncbi:uncharacterized protein LY89DRAFT_739776 [Mollisia scopiformis]|uniref:Uncharacterized protein n=1 Tax=Mollisia scopiformis TaxID=149040 RepID=A0A194WS39_MOLSC|nr:uncharacterized protein LY89DRAFT_739776 [Mollisia scopiformis]KUJ10786.1 hypothetical protein LY89DRAFT_739776 [Mollisia scopiformis]